MDPMPPHAPLPIADRPPVEGAPSSSPAAGRSMGARAGRLLGRLVRDEAGAEILEYVLIAGLIIVGTIVTIGSFGTKVMARWTSVNASM